MTAVWMRLPAIAGIGSREITAAEAALARATGAWAVRHGLAVRSGGADGADTAWQDGAAAVDPARVTVCLAGDDTRHRRRAPSGAQREIPPYEAYVIELAAAEYEFLEELPTIGLPPYADAGLQYRFETRPRWQQLVASRPYVAELMTRNARIVVPRASATVGLVLGFLNATKRGGGGTGHAFRLAHALGVPTFDLRDRRCRTAARAALQALAGVVA